MPVNKVDLHISQLIEDLNNGLTWLKKDDLGYGSVQEKYGANDVQINAIRKHPKLKDVETTATIFNVIDDTNSSIDLRKTEPVVTKTQTVPATAADELAAFASL